MAAAAAEAQVAVLERKARPPLLTPFDCLASAGTSSQLVCARPCTHADGACCQGREAAEGGVWCHACCQLWQAQHELSPHVRR